MGYTLPGAKMLMEVGVSRPFSGRVLQLGRQDIFFGQELLERAAAEVGFALQPADPEPLVRNPYLPGQPLVISDRYFFRRLGFQEIFSLDYSGFESASIVFDMNSAAIPDVYRQVFDVIIDGGTIEHIFHLPNALNNIFCFLKTDGLVVHTSPIHNFFEHGFYTFSPTFFHDFYAANDFEIVTSQLVRLNPLKKHPRYERTPLLPQNEALQELNRLGSLDARCYAIFFAAQKTPSSTGTVIPQQSAYLEKWPESDAASRAAGRLPGSAGCGAETKSKTRARKIIRKLTKRNKVAFSLYQAVSERASAPRIRWEKI